MSATSSAAKKMKRYAMVKPETKKKRKAEKQKKPLTEREEPGIIGFFKSRFHM